MQTTRINALSIKEECVDSTVAETKGNLSTEAVGLHTSHEAFLEWFSSENTGARSNKLGLGQFEGMGIGVVAQEDIKEGDEVLRLPLTAVFCRKTLTPMLGLDSLGFNSSKLSDRQLVAIGLILEKARLSEKSAWHEYLQVLPQEALGVPFTLQGEDLEEIQSATVVERARKRRAQLLSEHRSIIQPIMAVLAADDLAYNQSFVHDFDSFAWAVSLIDSRALTIQGNKFLVPYADMFNFKPHPQLRQSDSGAFFLKHHILDEDSFTVKADRRTAKGSQVFEDYGDTPNIVYFEFHAFVPDWNPFDCLEVAFNLSAYGRDAPETLSQDKLKLIRLFNLPATMTPCLRVSDIERAMVQQPLFYIYRILAMQDKEVSFCIESMKTEKKLMAGVKRCLQAVPQMEQRVKKQALSHWRVLFAELRKTTIEQDKELLDAKNLSSAKEVAVKFRISQKRLLHDLTNFLSTGALPPVSPRKDGHPFSGFGNSEQDSKRGFGAEPTLMLEAKVARFNAWFARHSTTDLKIRAAPSAEYRLGVVATRMIEQEEIYLAVPSRLILDMRSLTQSEIWPVIRDIELSLGKKEPFHSLLVFLMHEYFVEGVTSFWWPYLSLLPKPAELEIPLYHSEPELLRLRGHPVYQQVVDMQKKVAGVYRKVKTLIFDRYGTAFFPREAYTFEHYQWAHAILDSRSIWWNSERHLVPMLDLVNCRAGMNATRVHATTENDNGEAITRSDRNYESGAPLFEDYGQPNHIYYLYHGFTLAPNHHDCVAVKMERAELCVYDPIDSSRNGDVFARISKAELASAILSQYGDMLRKGIGGEKGKHHRLNTFMRREALLVERILTQLDPTYATEALSPIAKEQQADI